ncbi:MAG TPA: hypothetical protein VJ577_05605 [Burkholderiaceae bacterium]|nr:hypothetical protein [Burkholderiaceae bacterium]
MFLLAMADVLLRYPPLAVFAPALRRGGRLLSYPATAASMHHLSLLGL